MGITNVFYALVALHLVRVIGGTAINIWDQLYSCKHIVGLTIVEMAIKKKD